MWTHVWAKGGPESLCSASPRQQCPHIRESQLISARLSLELNSDKIAGLSLLDTDILEVQMKCVDGLKPVTISRPAWQILASAGSSVMGQTGREVNEGHLLIRKGHGSFEGAGNGLHCPLPAEESSKTWSQERGRGSIQHGGSSKQSQGSSGSIWMLVLSQHFLPKRRAVSQKVTPSQQQHLVSCGWSFQIWANSLDNKEMALAFQTSVIDCQRATSHAGRISVSLQDDSEVSLWSSPLAIHCGKSG